MARSRSLGCSPAAGWQLFANHLPKDTMSFVSGFNLTASVIHVVTYGRVKHSAHPLRGR
jgi:hypothetical protein